MKQIPILLLWLLLNQQGCAQVPLSWSLQKDAKLSHKHEEHYARKAARRQDKTAKEYRSLSQQIALVDFKFLIKDKDKLKKHHKHKEANVATGSVIASFYPVGTEIIKVPLRGVPLNSFLLEHEFDSAILATRLAAVKNAKATDVTNIYELHPEIIALNRGSITTMFPRAFLGMPQVANLSVMPDDLIYTIEKENLKSNVLGTTAGLNRHYRVSGFAKRTGPFFTGKGHKEAPASVTELATDYSKEFAFETPAVIVVHRVYQGQLLRILVPNAAFGAFRRPQLSEDEDASRKKAVKAAQKKWDDYFEIFYNMAIQDGDVIEFTTLDLLAPTLPLN